MSIEVTTSITAPQLFQLLQDRSASIILLDVRTAAEYAEQHIEGSTNVPLDRLAQSLSQLPAEKELIVICQSGKRASKACELLGKSGHGPKLLTGGLLSWKERGLPLKKNTHRLSIERQTQLTIGIGVLTGVLLGTAVNRWFLIIPAFFGAGLTFAGASGTCGLAMLLAKAPWNQLELPQQCPAAGGSCSK